MEFYWLKLFLIPSILFTQTDAFAIEQSFSATKSPAVPSQTTTEIGIGTLSPILKSYIPECARGCFTSFVDLNYAETTCGQAPTLDCLCVQSSTSGYTIGEGAIQCIASEVSAGVCGKDIIEGEVAFKAYVMCRGKKNALPNTHGTLTATFIVETSTTTSRASATTTKSNFSGSGITASTTSRSSFVPPTPVTTSKPPSSTTTSSSNTSAEAASGTPSASTAARNLTKEQITGISIGSVGVAALVLAALFFAHRRRKRTRTERDSDMLPFQLDPPASFYHSQHGFCSPAQKTGPGGTVNGLAGRRSPRPRVPPRIDTGNPYIFSRRSIKADTIGLAISPENQRGISEAKPNTLQRRSSKLLPEKPILSLKIPRYQPSFHQTAGPLSFPQNQIQPSTSSRQSTATQFEEDFDSDSTAVAANDSWNPNHNFTGLILQPSTGIQQTIRQVKPATRPAFFVTGGNGNHWRPGQAKKSNPAFVEPEYHVKPLELKRGQGSIGSFSQPRKPDTYSRPGPPQQHVQQSSYQPHEQLLQNLAKTQSQGQLMIPHQAERPITTTSSVYTTRTSLSSLAAEANDRTSNSAPPVPRSRNSYRIAGPYDAHASAGSLTSFETNDSFVVNSLQDLPSSPFDIRTEPVLPKIITTSSTPQNIRESKRKTINIVTSDLSPVVESPRSPRINKSPTSPGKSPVSYPKIPIRGRLPDKTIRMVPPPPQPDFSAAFSSGKPWRAAEMQARLQGKGREKTEEEKEGYRPPAKQSLQNHEMQKTTAPPETPYEHTVSPRTQLGLFDYQNSSSVSTKTTPTQLHVTPQSESQFIQRKTNTPKPNCNPASPNPPLTRPSSEASQRSQRSQLSTSSSLLAKRRGEKAAAALTLKNGEDRKPASGNKWRVLRKDEIENAKKEGWRPMLNSMASGEYHVREGELPRTPGWVPRLTPTRRGDELFLSVQ